jgi:hypothetical protein
LKDHPEIHRHIHTLRPEEREIVLLGLEEKSEDVKWSELAADMGMSSMNLRQKFHRALSKIKAALILQLYQQERYAEINRFRLSRNQMEQVASIALQKDLSMSCFEDAFIHVNSNRAIQNATWALVSIAEKKPEALKFLKQQFLHSDLFRGNITYIAEALIGLDSKHFAPIIRKHYLPRLNDMPSRVAGNILPFREQTPIRSRCLVDVINYQPVGPEIPAADIETLRKQFLNGSTDVDLHRTVTWMLLRIVSDEGRALKTVVESMADEHDQTNAYYVTKFIMRFGLKKFPEVIFNKRTLESLRTVKERWPQNLYFAQSAARFSMKQALLGGK